MCGADYQHPAHHRDALLRPADADEARRGGDDRRLLAGGARGDDRGRRTDRRTPIRAKDSRFIANRLAALLAGVAEMLGDGITDAATINRVCRLAAAPDGPVRADRPDQQLNINLSVARSSTTSHAGGIGRPIQAELVEQRPLGAGREGYYPRRRPTPPNDPSFGLWARPSTPTTSFGSTSCGGILPPRRPDRRRTRLRP